jgi:hypothetical protein
VPHPPCPLLPGEKGVKKNYKYIKSLPLGESLPRKAGDLGRGKNELVQKYTEKKQYETKRSLFISRFSGSHFISGRV